MKENKEQRLLDICIMVVKILLCSMLVFNAFVFVFFGLINKSDTAKEKQIKSLENLTVTNTGDAGQTVTAELPKIIENGEILYVETRNDVSVFISGELRRDFVEERDVNLPGGSFKRFLFMVPLKEEDAGCDVLILRKNVQNIDKELSEFFIGDPTEAFDHLLKTGGASFILSLIILIFAFVAFVVSIVLRVLYRQRINMLYGALGIFIIAAWLITDSYLFQFVFGMNHVGGLLNFMFCNMIPLSLGAYLTSLQRGGNKGRMTVAVIIAILNATVWPFLHFTGIVTFGNVRSLANAVLVLLSIAGIAILVIDAIKGNVAGYRYTFIGFLGFLVGCLIELSTVFLAVYMLGTVPMVIGLGFLLTFIVIQQVSDLRKINTEKQHAIDISEAKTRFLASMSHEIRTPINAILGMNEMILRENTDRTIEDYSRNIKSSGKMLLMLVNDVLDFTKIESGRLEIKEEAFSMPDMLYDVISLIKERAEEKDLSLEAEVVGDVPASIISDEFRIRQILVNILNNAVKYTDKGGVTLKVGGCYTDDGYELSLTVTDTGKGIRKEDQEHLFEAFSRADLKKNANIEGTGLGLAIVKSITDSMKGEVGVESEYGVGSSFYVRIPVKYEGDELLNNDFMSGRENRQASNTYCSFTAPDAEILAVDDNQSNLTIVKLFLKRNGIEPDLAGSGKRAAEMCRAQKYDLILMDHMMPEPDGIETLHMIRNDAASLNKDTAVIVLTANAVAGSRQMYMDAGFADYLTKPLDPGLLEETVKKMLPKEKVHDLSPAYTHNATGTLKDRLLSVEGLDYDKALGYCAGDEELLAEILRSISSEGKERAERMKKSLDAGDIKAYEIDAHTIKSSMATIGLSALSERAKRHEFAAKEGNTAFIRKDADAFIKEYEAICEKLKRI
ncbi:MAG: response regulator [Lachnospiraceae bacterium]|nr:response regulator [Lachnospiraceae bacterium]